ncbi:hypothetical protein BKA93DRAFT_715904, partial [Sparassis latifolia]
MSFKALLYVYVLGGVTFIPLLILGAIVYTIYTSVPVEDINKEKATQQVKEHADADAEREDAEPSATGAQAEVNDLPKVRKGWLTVRRTFHQTPSEASYVGMVRGFLDARSKDAKRSRPKDMWYVVLKGKILYLYEDELMTECEAAIELGSHEVLIYPEGQPDGELFARRNAICLRPKMPLLHQEMPNITKEMEMEDEDVEEKVEEKGGGAKHKQKERERLVENEKQREEAREEALDISTPWFIFVRSIVDMEDWYHALLHASDHPANCPMLPPLEPVFQPADMLHLVSTLDEQPDVIPMRWLNALLGRVFFSYYRTHKLEKYIIGRLMKKISRIKRPMFLSDIVVREVSVGNKTPTLSKPMLKELTKEGDAALELHLHYKGEFRITVEATATINLGARFKSYTVKLVLALVLREIEGNLLLKVKRPPSSRIWYAFTQMPRIVLDVEPVVSDRQITWSMILSTIQSRVREVIQESIVLPNMDDISFFESTKYQRRGGIWADASRHEQPKPPSSFSPPLTLSSEGRVTTSTPAMSPPRRRSWFGAVPGDESEVSSSKLNPDASYDGIQRGRSSGADSISARRSVSNPIHVTEDTSADGFTPQALDGGDGGDSLAPSLARRTSSHRSHSYSSSSRDASSPPSSDEESPAPSVRSSIVGNRGVRTNGSVHNAPASSTASSFLQTLKSRAGDKQALSNTAKEAMRKWGVNWGGLRRESNGNTSSGNASGRDDADNADPQHLREPRTHRPRPSYAEVRATVEQRRERGLSSEQTLGADLRASDPIPIPQNGKGKERERSVSPSPLLDNAGSSVHSTGGLSTSTPPQPGAGARSTSIPRSVSPSLALQRSESHKSNEEEEPHLPIHTQPPQARTMTIPGIHASHRGEVMSMGYAPPPPPPNVPSETRKAPAIQSVYRLWKNPNAPSSSPPLRGTESAPETLSGSGGHDQDPALSPPEAQADAPPPPRPVPPPLPPRTNSTHALLSKADVVRRAAEADPSASPASAALQSIVSKDRSKRPSLER